MKYRNIVSCQFSTKAVRGMHFHQDPEIIYVLDGTLEVDYEDSSHFLRTDDFMLINSNVRHEYHSDGDVLLGSVFIDHAMLTEIFGGEELCFWCNSAEEKSAGYDKMRYYIRLIFNYYQTTEGQGIALKNSIFYQLIYLITTDFIVKKGMLHYDSAQWNKDARMNEIMNFIMTNYSEPITLKELSERLYLSNTYLSKYIKQNFGMSFLKLLNNIRLEHAVSDLLYTDKTVLKIAMENGFSNQAGFNHAFKESYHTTPAEYRQQMQGKRSQTGHGETDKNVMERVEQYLISNFVEPPDVEDSTVMTVDVDAEHREILERRWCRLINIGRASDLMRFDVREQVRMLKENLHFEYVRFWGILSRDMMVELKEHNTRYNFKAIDQVFDFLVGLSLKPHVELGFKDNEIFGKIDPEMLKKNRSNPMDVMRKNGAFLEEVIKHLTRRYGVREVETWHFEMEKNSVVQEEIPIETYLDAFDVVAGILRTYVPRVRLGGAGFCLNYMGKEFPLILKKWKKHRQQPDFISIYSYPYIFNRDLLDAGRSDYSPDVDYLARQIQEARQIMEAQGFGDKELYVTEWSSTLSNRNCLNDSCFKSAYILRNLIQNYDRADAIAYWSATDILAESIESQTLLFGGCGLISRDGIRKPAYFAYEYMDYLGKYMLKRNQNALISGNESGVFFICCHNFKAFNFRYYTQDESKIEVENQRRLFEDNESMQMTFRFHHVNNGEYVIKIFSVNQENGNVQQEWKRLDYFSELAIPEIEYLKTLCQPRLTIHSAKAADHTLVVETRLEAQEIQGIVIAEM